MLMEVRNCSADAPARIRATPAISPPFSTRARRNGRSSGFRKFFPFGRRDADKLGPTALAAATPPALDHMGLPRGPTVAHEAAYELSNHKPAPATRPIP